MSSCIPTNTLMLLKLVLFYTVATVLLGTGSATAKPAVTTPSLELIEGDILVDPKLVKIRSHGLARDSLPNSRARRGLTFTNKQPHEHRWKSGFVPYKLSHELGELAIASIREAFRQIEKYTCIRFSPWAGEEDYVEIVKGNGCYSSIGRQNGKQILSLGEGCETAKTAIHELLHTLGMFHEQTRMDRGLYVRVLWWNVQHGAEKNFAVYDHGVIDAMDFPYDYASAMHYHNREFTKNGQDTVQSLERPHQRLGNTRGMSKIDVNKVYLFYKCYKKKQRPQKSACKDKYLWCAQYKRHCSTAWFAETYCQKTCQICL